MIRNKARLFVFYTTLIVSSLVISFSVLKNLDNLSTKASSQDNTIVFSSIKNTLLSQTGSQSIVSESNGEINFSYDGYSSLTNSWGSLSSGGYFKNSDPIHGLKTIDITFKDLSSSFVISYSASQSDADIYKEEVNSISSLKYSFAFDEYLPNYFKFEATSICNIEKINITYSCEDSHIPYTVTYHLNGGSLLEAPMSEKYSFTCNRVNTGLNDYNSHYSTDAFIFYNDNAIQTLYAHKIGLVKHNIDNEYIVHEIVPSGTSIYNKGLESEYFIIAHGGLSDNQPQLYSYLLNTVKVGDILRVNKTLGTASNSNANTLVTFYNNDEVITKTYYDHPYTLNSSSKDDSNFIGYYSNSSFTGELIALVTDNSVLYAKYDTELSLREKIVKSMYDMSQIEWTPSTTITYYTNDSTKQFVAGTKYVGLPYTMGGGRTTTQADPLGIFKSKLDTDNYTYIGPTGYNSYYGSDCSSSVSGAWRVNGIETNATYTGNMIPGENSNIIALGDYTYSDRTNMTKTICTDNGSTKIYSGYDLLEPGDAIVRRVSTDSGWAGHVRLVTSVDITNKTVTVIEQCGYVSGSNTTWKVYKQYSYSTLFSNSYIPIRPVGL